MNIVLWHWLERCNDVISGCNGRQNTLEYVENEIKILRDLLPGEASPNRFVRSYIFRCSHDYYCPRQRTESLLIQSNQNRTVGTSSWPLSSTHLWRDHSARPKEIGSNKCRRPRDICNRSALRPPYYNVQRPSAEWHSTFSIRCRTWNRSRNR